MATHYASHIVIECPAEITWLTDEIPVYHEVQVYAQGHFCR